jgi:hypothetical protein
LAYVHQQGQHRCEHIGRIPILAKLLIKAQPNLLLLQISQSIWAYKFRGWAGAIK